MATLNILSMYLFVTHTYSLPKTAHLKPSSISTLPSISVSTSTGVTVTNDKWHIHVLSQQDADLNISFNNEWAFHPTYPSSIQLYIQGNTPNSTYYKDGEIVFVFSVNNQYFAQVISLDQHETAYKECPNSNTPLINRDINEMISSLLPDRYHRSCKNPVDTPINDAIDYWNTVGSIYKQPAKWPMLITITNDPILNTIAYTWTDSFAGTNKVTSTYTSSFNTNQGLNIYISGEGTFEEFFIFSVDVTHSNIPTKQPTNRPTIPTSNPTQKPTTNPTYKPSVNPTAKPTNNPTYNPTNLPTKPPTLSPIKTPTFIPTNLPTKNPSYFPTISPIKINPTVYPTYIPTFLPTDVTNNPSFDPTYSPNYLTNNPTLYPSGIPTVQPTGSPIVLPTVSPSTKYPSKFPSKYPTFEPSKSPTHFKVTEANSNSGEEEFTTTYIINSYSPNFIIDNILPIIIGVLILTICISGCCLCHYICCTNKHKKIKISEKKDPIDENINKSQKNISEPVLHLEPKKYTVPEKCQIFIPSNSSAASMIPNISKSGNYSKYSSDSYANTFNIAASPSLFSEKHKRISPHLSSNNSVGSYVNYNKQSKSLQQYQLQQIISHPNNMQPIYHKSNYNKQTINVFTQKSFQSNVSNAMSIPPPPPLPVPINVFSPSESAPRPSPYVSNLLNALPPPIPLPEFVSINGGDDIKLNENNEGDTDNEYISESTNTDSECNSILKFNKHSIHSNSSKSLHEQKTEQLDHIERTKNKSVSRMKVFKPPNEIYSNAALPQTIYDDHETENSQIVLLHEATGTVSGTMIINDSYSDIEPGSVNHIDQMRVF